MPWPRKFIARSEVAKRRICIITLRSTGMTWDAIALETGCRTPQHARLDWLRALGLPTTAPHHD